MLLTARAWPPRRVNGGPWQAYCLAYAGAAAHHRAGPLWNEKLVFVINNAGAPRFTSGCKRAVQMVQRHGVDIFVDRFGGKPVVAEVCSPEVLDDPQLGLIAGNRTAPAILPRRLSRPRDRDIARPTKT